MTGLAPLPRTGRERFLAALRAGPQDRPPVWFMRQAGRHLPGYRALRQRASFLDVCRKPDICRIASIEPLHRYAVDAVIVFNDILIPLQDMGMSLDFTPAPKFERLLATTDEVAALADPSYDQSTDVARCLSALRREAGGGVAMLGFIGAPFTVAAFAIAGAGTDKAPLPASVQAKHSVFAAMQQRLVPVLAEYARIQAQAGADTIQIFESLAERLSPEAYERVGLPSLLATIAAVRDRCPQTPIIVFGRGLQQALPQIASHGVALGIEPGLRLADVRSTLRRHGLVSPLQGNLDPTVLNGSPIEAAAAAEALLTGWRDIVPDPSLADALGPTGWVFNLGHGVPADANPDSVQAVMDTVRGFDFGRIETEQEVAS